MDERELAGLPRDEALRLLGSVPFGRVVFTEQALPAIRPVNHLMDGDKVVIRASLLSAISQDIDGLGTVVAYEADLIDSVSRLGWSVVVVGRAVRVADGPACEQYLRRLRPWVAGEHEEVISISTDLVTGYRLVPQGPAGSGQQAM